MKLLAFFFAAALLWGQTPPAATPPPAAAPSSANEEQNDLSRAVAESGTTGIDFIRALERHLQKYPQSEQRAGIEKALAKAALDSNDHARILLYGEKVLQAEPAGADLPLIDAVVRALLDTDDPASAKKALEYVKRYEAAVEGMRSRAAEGHMSPGLWAEEVDKGKARAMVLEARATGNAGNAEDALRIAKTAWQTYPGAEVAREVGRWLVRLKREGEAIEYYADAFEMEDSRSTEADLARDRAKVGEIYTRLNGSEKGLGDLLLQAWDRMRALKVARTERLKQADPNALARDVDDFTLPRSGGGAPLAISSLKGKTVVIDFWATWCGPCRAQHPLIENVKKRFENNADVVFLSVDADEDRSLVAPFLRDMKWDDAVYFDAGLSYMLKISSMPTLIVLDAAGKVSSRMAGFIPERFEDMLAQRIDDARQNRETRN